MGWVGRVRRVFVPALALSLIAPLLVPVGVASADHGDALPLQEAIGEALAGLAGIDTADAVLDPIPLTPAGLDEVLSLPAVLSVLDALVRDAAHDLPDLQQALRAGVDLNGVIPDPPDGIDTLLIKAKDPELDLASGLADLTITYQRSVTSPLVALSDLVAYDAGALPVTATFSADLLLEFDPGAENLEVTLGEVKLGAEVGARFGAVAAGCPSELVDLGALAMNVGILEVQASGEACGKVALEAGAAGTFSLDDWTATPPRDLFQIAEVDASATVDLDVTADLDGLEEVTGKIALDWTADAAGDLIGWQQAVSADLDVLDDFRNIEVEEVIAGIAQLAVALGATQLSGAADFRLPLLRERTSELAHLGQGVLDWLLEQKTDDGEVALARLADDGRIQLLDELDRAALIALNLTDLQKILDSLEAELDIGDLGASYDPGETELRFDLGWDRGVSDIGLPGKPEELRFNLSDRLAAATGLSGLVAAEAGDTSIEVTPQVTAELGIAIDLSFDHARAELEALDFDLDAFKDAGGNPDALLAVGERVKILTDGSSVGLDLPVTGTLDLAGTIGFLGLSAKTATDALRIEAAGDGPMLSFSFADGADEGYLTLDELVDGLVTDTGSTIDVDLDVSVPDFDLDLVADLGGQTLAGNIEIGVDWIDITKLPTLKVDTGDLGDLLDFQFSLDPFELLELILRGVDELTQRLEEEIRAGTDLGTVPLVDVDVADLVVGLREVREQLGVIATDPAATLQGVGAQLNCLLVEALGAGTCVGGETPVQLVTLEVLSEPTTVVIKLDLGVCSDASATPGCAFDRQVSVPFELDLADLVDGSLADILGSVVGMSSQGQVEVDYELIASIHAGVELPDVSIKAGGVDAISDTDEPEDRFDKVFDVSGSPRIVLFDSTGIRGEVEVDAAAILDVNVGPISASAGRADVPTVAKVGVSFALEHGDAAHAIGELGAPIALSTLGTWVGGLSASLSSLGDPVVCPAGLTGDAPVTIRGTVAELDGGPITGATVTLSGGASESTTTDGSGEFEIDGLPTGTYTVSADADGYESWELTGVELGSGQTGIVALELAPTPEPADPPEDTPDPENGTATLVDTETDTQLGLVEPARGSETFTDPMQACARLPLYVRGDKWIGDIVFTAPEVLNTDSWEVTVPDDLLDRLGEALLDWRLLFDGLRYVVAQVAQGLDGASTGVRVPVVGEVLDGGAGLAADLDAVLTALADDIDDIETLDDASELEDELQGLLDEAFALLDDEAANPITVDVQCGTSSCDGDESVFQVSGAEVRLQYGDSVGTTLPAFDLGFPGLSLNIDDPEDFADGLEGQEAHALQAEVAWGLDLQVGLERSGFYLRTKENAGDGDYLQQMQVKTTVNLPDKMTGDLALLRVALDKKSPSTDDLDLTIGAEVRAGTDRVPLHQLLTQLNKDTFVIDVDAQVDFAYAIETSATLPGQTDVEEVFPTLLADFVLEWNLKTDSSKGFRLDGGLPAPTAFGFDEVRVDLGEFVSGFLGPILGEVQRFTAPFQPVIDTISTPIPGLSDLSEAMGLGPVTMLVLFDEISDNDLTFIKRIIGIVELVNEISNVTSNEVIIPLGSFQLDTAEALRSAKPASKRGDLIGGATQLVADAGNGLFDTSEFKNNVGGSHSVERSREGGGFSFPAFETPSLLFGLLVGEDVALVRWDSGTLKAGFAVSYNFPPIFVGPVPIGFSLSAAAQIAGRFAIGYDTYGIRRSVEAFNALEPGGSGSTAGDIEAVLGGVSMLFNGIYLDDLDKDGNQVPELVLSAEFAAGAGLSLGIISAGLELGLRALIDFDLRDPTGTGRIRIQHILQHIRTPICLFEVGGQLDVFLRAFVKISLGFTSKTANFTIFNFTILRLDDIFEGFCGPKPPNLAKVVSGDNGSVLVLSTGSRASTNDRGVGFEPDGTTYDPDEEFVVRPINAERTSFSVAAFGEYEEYHGVTGVNALGREVFVVADGGSGEDTIQLLDGVLSDVDDQIDDPEKRIGTTEIPMDRAAVICGGSGDDVLVGGRGDDLLIGDGSCSVGAGPTITVSLTEKPPADPEDPQADEDGNDRLYATAGDNLLFGLGGRDQLYGGTGNDVLVGGSGDDTLKAGDLDPDSPEYKAGERTGDVLVGGGLVASPAGAGSLLNGAGALPLPSLPSPGNDDLYGGNGDDVLIGDHGGTDAAGRVWVRSTGSGGANYLEGGRGDDRLFGGTGNDELFGGRGDDFLYGGAGNDVLVGGSGDDDGSPGSNVLVGGAGNDRLVAHDATIERDEDGGIETLTPVDGPSTDDAILIGGGLTDVSAPGDDELWGSGGNDLLIGDNATPAGDLAPTTDGSVVLFQHQLTSSAFADLGARDGDGYPTGLSPLQTNGGNDRLYGGPGDDTLIGGPGHDVLVGGWPVRSTAAGISVARVAAGDDLLVGDGGDDLLIGDHADVVPPEVTTAVGAAVPATLLPSSDVTSNRLIGGSWGVEPIAGNPGNDRLLAGRHGDVLVGDDGHITSDGSVAADRVVTVLLDVGGTDELIGGAGDDRLFGGPGNDLLRGGGGNDYLEGGPDDDRLFGGAGHDILIGGSSRPDVPSGNNLLVGEAGDDVLAGDNARIERVTSGTGLHDSAYLVELFDVPLDGTDPDDATAGDDVLIGGSLGGGTGSDDLLFGQGGEDLLFGDGARAVAPTNEAAIARYGDITSNPTHGRFVPIESGPGGDDLLSGGPGDDALFGGPGEDILLGGSGVMTAYELPRDVPSDDDVHVVPAIDPDPEGGLTRLEGAPSGDDLLAGGLGDDLLIGDNARVERIPGAGIDDTDFVVERFDLAEAGEIDPGDVLGGDDVLIGGILGGGEATSTMASDDVLYGLGGDDLLFGDNASLAAADPSTSDDPVAAERYGDLGLNQTWGRFVPVDGGSGGEDRLEGGAGHDVLFGGPGDDVLVGGSDRHQPFAGDEIEAGGWIELSGMVAGNDVLVGGRGEDVMVGDNARIGGDPEANATQMATLFGIEIGPLAASPESDILLYDVAYAGEAAPHRHTAGDDVLIGGSIGGLGDEVGDSGNDVGFGQGGDDLLIGDDAQVLHDDERRFAPLHGEGGDDHLEGGPGGDAIFGGPGDDLLIGGSSDRAVPAAATNGVVAGDDLLVGGPGQNVALGDNGRLRHAGAELDEQPSDAWWPHPTSDPAQPWWWQQHEGVAPHAGAAIEPFDEPLLGEDQPHADTAGDDLLVGGSLRAGVSSENAAPNASGEGLLTHPDESNLPGSSLLHGQNGDDAMFGDDALVRLDLLEDWKGDNAAGAWQTLRSTLADTIGGPRAGWPLVTIDEIESAAAAGGDDLLLGGPGDDVMFGGPGQDDMIGGSWDDGRLDGRDQMDTGPGHDVAAGDNARIARPLVDGWAASRTAY
jgi:Ca2+-binding RTX toxin-like protein